MLERVKNFTTLIGVSALLVAGSAAFFSVFGLSKLFSGAQTSVIIMAGSLEFSKLVAASFLYQYWYSMSKVLKTYLSLGVAILVIITSAGIFGYLSNAYQGATVNFEKQSTSLLYKEDRLEQLSEDKEFLKEELEAAVAELPENYRTAKRQLREEYQPKINQINTDMMTLKSEIGDLKVELVETGVDVGPAIFLARAFETDVDTVVKFFIFILIFVFDPMALAMVLAWNTAVGRRSFEVYEEGDRVEKIFQEYKEEKKPKKQSQWIAEKIEEPTSKKPDLRKGGINAVGKG
tara:strand:+ start:1323 stop:2195 length:873 start_codon:yes stop_codon:yes gene_type:complete